MVWVLKELSHERHLNETALLSTQNIWCELMGKKIFKILHPEILPMHTVYQCSHLQLSSQKRVQISKRKNIPAKLKRSLHESQVGQKAIATTSFSGSIFHYL